MTPDRPQPAMIVSAHLHMGAAVRAAARGDRQACKAILDRYVDLTPAKDIEGAVFVAAYGVGSIVHGEEGNLVQTEDRDAAAGLAAALVGAAGLRDPVAGWEVWRQAPWVDRVNGWVILVLEAGRLIREQADG